MICLVRSPHFPPLLPSGGSLFSTASQIQLALTRQVLCGLILLMSCLVRYQAGLLAAVSYESDLHYKNLYMFSQVTLHVCV